MRFPRLAAALTVAAVTLSGGIASAVVAPVAAAAAAPSAAMATARPAIAKPAISKQPVARTASAGTTATFRVTAKGNALRYQWQQKLPSQAFKSMAGKTSSSLNVSATPAKNKAQYRVVIRNGGGQLISKAATLTVVVAKPRITGQPSSVSTTAGQRVSLSVKATGYATRYQWQTLVSGKWQNVAGATSSTRSFTATTALSGRQFRVVVKNTAGSATSKTVSVKVASTRSDPYRANVKIGVSPSWQVQVERTDSNAWQGIRDSLSNPTPPRSGYRYVAVFADVRYTGAGSADAWLDLDLEFVGGDGRVYGDTDRLYWSNSIYSTPELYRNGTAEFAAIVEVPASAVAAGKWRVTDTSDWSNQRTAWWGLS